MTKKENKRGDMEITLESDVIYGRSLWKGHLTTSLIEDFTKVKDSLYFD